MFQHPRRSILTMLMGLALTVAVIDLAIAQQGSQQQQAEALKRMQEQQAKKKKEDQEKQKKLHDMTKKLK